MDWLRQSHAICAVPTCGRIHTDETDPSHGFPNSPPPASSFLERPRSQSVAVMGSGSTDSATHDFGLDERTLWVAISLHFGALNCVS